MPVDEVVYKRLQLLQGQLTRNVQHVAGLNPKAFRSVDFLDVHVLTSDHATTARFETSMLPGRSQKASLMMDC